MKALIELPLWQQVALEMWFSYKATSDKFRADERATAQKRMAVRPRRLAYYAHGQADTLGSFFIDTDIEPLKSQYARYFDSEGKRKPELSFVKAESN